MENYQLRICDCNELEDEIVKFGTTIIEACYLLFPHPHSQRRRGRRNEEK
jgi:hypothetical protein